MDDVNGSPKPNGLPLSSSSLAAIVNIRRKPRKTKPHDQYTFCLKVHKHGIEEKKKKKDTNVGKLLQANGEIKNVLAVSIEKQNKLYSNQPESSSTPVANNHSQNYLTTSDLNHLSARVLYDGSIIEIPPHFSMLCGIRITTLIHPDDLFMFACFLYEGTIIIVTKGDVSPHLLEEVLTLKSVRVLCSNGDYKKAEAKIDATKSSGSILQLNIALLPDEIQSQVSIISTKAAILKMGHDATVPDHSNKIEEFNLLAKDFCALSQLQSLFQLTIFGGTTVNRTVFDEYCQKERVFLNWLAEEIFSFNYLEQVTKITQQFTEKKPLIEHTHMLPTLMFVDSYGFIRWASRTIDTYSNRPIGSHIGLNVLELPAFKGTIMLPLIQSLAQNHLKLSRVQTPAIQFDASGMTLRCHCVGIRIDRIQRYSRQQFGGLSEDQSGWSSIAEDIINNQDGHISLKPSPQILRETYGSLWIVDILPVENRL